jgi:large subunit ribosomal protein L6
MSRVGKKPVPLPAGVKVTAGEQILVEGPKGKLTVPALPGVRVEQNNGAIEVKRDGDSYAAVHGLTRALLANAVTGVSAGFTREMDIVGIGYRAEMKGDQVISFSLGYSHPIEFVLPKGVTCKIDKQTHLTLSSIDKQQLGQICANIRSLRPPEPYKQKGIRYTGEALRKKVGKTGAGGK